jgi:hypothetical protein
MIRLPRNNTAREPSPAPLHNAAKNLEELLAPNVGARRQTHNRFHQHQLSTGECLWIDVPFIAGSEVVADEVLGPKRVKTRSEREEEKGHFESSEQLALQEAQVGLVRALNTSGFHFLGADPNELLNLLGLYFLEGPGFFPFWLCGLLDSDRKGILLRL